MEALVFDAVVIGGGVVGCAILRELCCYEGRFMLLEKDQTASGASSGNSGIWHSGFDCSPSAPLERQLVLRSNELAPLVLPALSFPHAPGAGALLVAWNADEHSQLTLHQQKACANRCPTRVLGCDELYEREPALQPGALGALLIPGERVIDSYDLVHAYAAHARANGGTLREYSQAVDGSIHGEGTSGDGRRFWRVNVLAADGQRECICARAVINAAGLHADGINRAFLNDSSFDIMPRMGEFAVLGGSSLQVPLKHIILPFPSQRTKGVLLTPTLSGHVLIGPTAVDVAERDARAARCDESTAQHLIQFAREKLRVRSCETVVSTYAGLRPATQHQDYVIRAHADKLWVTVAGIRSTGVSASLGIAEYTVQLLQSVLGPLQDVGIPLHPLARLRRAGAEL